MARFYEIFVKNSTPTSSYVSFDLETDSTPCALILYLQNARILVVSSVALDRK